MIKFPSTAAVLLIAQLSLSAQAETTVSSPIVYAGMCDASAAVALTDKLFAVASDEDSVIRVYNRERSGSPVQSIDLSAFLDLDARKPESDLEAAARTGDRAYWITSHGRNRSGKLRLSRERFFATQIITNAQGIELKIVGRPYEDLLRDLTGDPKLARFNLAEAARHEPKARGALNIEGLSAMPNGGVLFGLRNPIPDGPGALAPMVNPGGVIPRQPAKILGP